MKYIYVILVVSLMIAVSPVMALASHDDLKAAMAAGGLKANMDTIYNLAHDFGSVLPVLVDRYNADVDSYDTTFGKWNDYVIANYPDSFADLLLPPYMKI